MRLKSSIWVSSCVRRCDIEGAFAAVRRRGAEEACAIFVKISRLDGTGALYGPAPQSMIDDEHWAERLFTALAGAKEPAPDADIEARLPAGFKVCAGVWVM